MSKIVLMIFLCVSLQACSNSPSSSDEERSPIRNEKPKAKERNGALAFTEIMAAMESLRIQVE